MTEMEANFMSMDIHMALLMEKLPNRMEKDDHKVRMVGMPSLQPPGYIAPVSDKMVDG